ncbi:MAG: ferredoxin, partial [Halobacteriovoraceae bacterium]|nr:ferredoxin [Halobacteriovoraceae bacterium]
FIAETLPEGEKTLKLAANPVYAGQFANLATGTSGTPGSGGAAAENFAVSKVWIIEGCIVCNACEDIYPEVFHVTADTCIVRDEYPKEDGLKVEEAAEACPVEVIKYTKT